VDGVSRHWQGIRGACTREGMNPSPKTRYRIVGAGITPARSPRQTTGRAMVCEYWTTRPRSRQKSSRAQSSRSAEEAL
jgi:hypothetical protein